MDLTYTPEEEAFRGRVRTWIAENKPRPETRGDLEALRGGDTLVRTLTFESKEEEYAYELDRNETHEMLLRVLVEERAGTSTLNAMATRFVTRARELRPTELPEVSWDMGDPFTNLQEGLMIAERLIAKHPSASPQLLVITDGQPTAYFTGRELHVEWPMGFVERMTQINRGRAFFTSPEKLGSFLMVDYLRGHRKRAS